MIAACALGNENCFDMEIRLLYCYKTLSHMDWSTVENRKKKERVFFFLFSRMPMNDLMRARKSDCACNRLATECEKRF